MWELSFLSQKDEQDAEHPVAYYSRKLLPREERYSTIEKECLAIKLGIHAFRVYLLGKPFTIETDHRALEWLDRVKDNNPLLTRWTCTSNHTSTEWCIVLAILMAMLMAFPEVLGLPLHAPNHSLLQEEGVWRFMSEISILDRCLY